MVSKKGVSPLIATVLLLAFAVSIATIIVQLEPFTSGCGMYSAEIMKQDGQKKICYDQNEPGINIFLTNGKYDIRKLKVSVTGEDDIKNQDIYEKIEKHTAGKVKVDYSLENNGQPQKILITPTYNKSNEMVQCPLDVDVDKLSDC